MGCLVASVSNIWLNQLALVFNTASISFCSFCAAVPCNCPYKHSLNHKSVRVALPKRSKRFSHYDKNRIEACLITILSVVTVLRYSPMFEVKAQMVKWVSDLPISINPTISTLSFGGYWEPWLPQKDMSNRMSKNKLIHQCKTSNYLINGWSLKKYPRLGFTLW